jgi:2-phosphosulfolactate phosphatase
VYYDQSAYDIRCEWGLVGIAHLAGAASAVVIVDVLSFTTAVDVAVSRRAIVYPYRWDGRDSDTLQEFARANGAVAAGSRRGDGYTLSPASLTNIDPGTRLVLPSPNGATLTLAVEGPPVFAGCLRNATAVANAVECYGPGVLLVPAGERWPDGTLRPSIEDLIGAGAIISRLPGTMSPEALTALAAFKSFEAVLLETLRESVSGRELIERGFSEDVELAADLDSSDTAPLLVDGAYRPHNVAG